MSVYRLNPEQHPGERGLIVICACHLDNHQLRLHYDKDDPDWGLSITYHLSPVGGFFRRLWRAVKYTFGHRSRFGEFGEVLIMAEEATAMAQLLQEFAGVCKKA